MSARKIPRLLRALGAPHLMDAATRVDERYIEVVRACAARLQLQAVQPVPVQLYHVLPWMWRETWHRTTEAQCETLAVAGLCYFSQVLVTDRLADGDASVTLAEIVVGGALHEQAVTFLACDLGFATRAHGPLLECRGRWLAALTLEQTRLQDRCAPASLVEYEQIAMGKAAYLHATPLLLAELDGAAASDDVASFLDNLNVANQVADDLEDWRVDLSQRRGSYLTKLLVTAGHLSADAPTTGDDVETVGEALFMSGFAEEMLAFAEAKAGHARARAVHHGWQLWARLAELRQAKLRELGQACAAQRSQIHGVLAGMAAIDPGKQAKGESEAADGVVGRALTAAVGFLVSCVHRPPDTLSHRMRFPCALGFSGAREEYSGELFALATVAWAVRCIARASLAEPVGTLEEIAARILRLREGQLWSYFPGLVELPPDSDDLAQVLLGLSHTGDGVVRDSLEQAVRLLLAQHVHADGSVDTWMEDPSWSDERRALVQASIARWWGRRADPEVAANVHFALLEYGGERHLTLARAGAEWLVRLQSPTGTWSSGWYVGPFYGSYVCARLLARVGGYADPLTRLRQWYHAQQRSDGGWGVRESDALSTALAVLAWRCSSNTMVADDPVVSRGVDYLLLSQRPDGAWPSTDLIRMDLARAHVGFSEQNLMHGLPALTTAFCVAALAETASGRGAHA